jgi:riboflavin kinase/FMN adenylyltransferase
MTSDEKAAAIRACGVREVVTLDFTPELAALEPAAFVEQYLDYPDLAVRCGANWKFGAHGRGDADFLRARGVAVAVVPYAEYRGARVSSTRIRQAFAAGEIEEGNAMLGRALTLGGKIVKGKGLGSQLGFPTVNIAVTSTVELPLGVYAVEAHGRRGVANYGYAPTLGARAWERPMLEVHWLGSGQAQLDPHGLQPDPLHGQPAQVELVRFLRPERKFETVEELKAQIARDCEAVNR